MKLKSLIALIIISNLTFGQSKTITRLDGSKISVSEVDQIVKILMDTANVQGLDLAILNNKKTVYLNSYGYKNKPNAELLDTNTVM